MMNPIQAVQQWLHGFERWQRTLYIMFVAQLMTTVGFSSIFAFLPLYVVELGSTSGLSVELLSGLVFSGQAFAMMIASPIWGTLADRFSRKAMVQRAQFGGALMLLLMGLATSAEQLIVLRTIQGLITGVIGATNALVAAETPRERTGYAMGLLQVGQGTGIALGPIIGGALADLFNYRVSFFITAVLLMGSGLLVLFGVREQQHGREKDLPREQRPGVLQHWGHIMRSPGVLPTYGLRFLVQMGRVMLIPFAPLFVATIYQGAALNSLVGLVTGIASATTTASGIYFGRLGDRIGHRRILIVSMVLAALAYLPQSLVQQAWQLLVLQALTGVALGGIIPTISALLAQYTIPGEEGSVYGLDNALNSAGRSVAPLLGSAVIALSSLRGTFVATAAVFLLGGIIALRWLPAAGAEIAQREREAQERA